jgi:epoxyqueuosine reductase QueG
MTKNKADTRLIRWSFKEHKGSLFKRYSPNNPGKQITDTNPYIEIDPEKFEYYTELAPLTKFVRGMYARIYINKLIKNMFDSEYGKGLTKIFRKKYRPRIAIDIIRQTLEAKGIKKPKVAEEKENDLLLLKRQIIDFAEEQGFLAGFTKIDRRFIADEKDSFFPYDTVIILGRKMEKDQVMEIPHPGYKTRKLYIYETYKEAGKRVHRVADFIRSKGYQCLARVPIDGMLKVGPHAVNAGMGQFTTNGLVITQEYGTSIRFCAINIDADIPIDHPRDLNADEFCARCRLCQKCCPAEAIPKEAFEWRGGMKRKVHDKKCLSSLFSPDNPLCGVCLKVCPYNNFGYEQCMENIPQYYRYNTMSPFLRETG